MTALWEEGLRCDRLKRRGREVGLELRDTTLVIFGSPSARTAMALGDGAVSPRALDPAFKSTAGWAGANLQGGGG